MTPACFLGAGIASSLGTGVPAHLAALRKEPALPGLVYRHTGNEQVAIPCKLLADFPLADIDTRLARVIDAVVEQALAEAGLPHAEWREVALFIGSSSFDISISEHAYRQAKQHSSDAIPLSDSPSFGNLAQTVRRRFGFLGAAYSFNTACTSSANALWYASRLIDAGELRYALVLGVEVFNDMTALGFHSLGLLTRSVMKPFDRDRDGLVLGEAATAVLLGPGDASHYRLWGGANLCDTYSMSAANADGSTVAEVIRQAVGEAGITTEAVTAIKVHGTASLLNDEAEAAGLLQVFPALPALCALKPFIGHTLGACGLAELVLVWRALADEQPFLPATPGIGADASVLGLALQQTAVAPPPGLCLLNYFGFGGNNTALLMGRGR